MSKNTIQKVLKHPDRDEILSKIIIGHPLRDITSWLKAKYTNPNENKFVISEKDLRSFQENYLDIYNMIQEDLVKTKTAIAMSNEDELRLVTTDLPAYKEMLIKSANEELDIRKTVKNMCIALENRVSQVFDSIQEDPRNINTRIDRLLIDYCECLGNLLDKAYKFIEVPINQTVTQNITLRVVDQHITVFHDVIKETLSRMDLESSLLFLEVFNEKMSKLKMPENDGITPPELRLAEAKLLNETINKKIN